MLDERIYESYIGILKEEMVPAMGCTEPIALAYGAARAREVLGKEPEHITAKCSGYTFGMLAAKHAMGQL